MDKKLLKLQRMKYPYFLSLLLMSCWQTNVEQKSSQYQNNIDSSVVVKKEANPPLKASNTLSPKDKILSDAVAISNDFYNCLLLQNYPAANKYLHKDALSVTTVSEWIEIYSKAQTKTGKLGFVKMVAHGAKIGFEGGNGKGDYAELVFDSQYKDGNLREKLIFFRKDSTEALKILGYEYNAILDKVRLTEDLEE